MKNKKRMRCYIIYSLAITAGILAIASKPNTEKLSEEKVQLKQLDQEKRNLTSTPILESKSKNVTFNLPELKKTASENLSRAISDIYGSASTTKLKREQRYLQKILGKEFLTKAMGSPQQLYLNNESTTVNFGNASNISSVPISVITTYWYKNAAGKKIKNYKMYMLDYNLKKQLVNDAKEVELIPVGGRQSHE